MVEYRFAPVCAGKNCSEKTVIRLRERTSMKRYDLCDTHGSAAIRVFPTQLEILIDARGK